MLDKVASATDGSEASAAASSGSWQPLHMPELSQEEIGISRKLYGRRVPKDLPLLGGNLTLSPAWQNAPVELNAPWSISFAMNDRPCRLVVSEMALGTLVKQLPFAVPFNRLMPPTCGLLIEHVLTDALNALEPLLETRLEVTSAQRVHAGIRGDDRTGVPIEFRFGGEAATGLLYGDADAIEQFAKLVARISAPAPALDCQIGVNIRWASVELSVAELKSLTPGDIVMVDHVTSGSQSALAVFGEHLFAPVKVVPDGFKLLTSVKGIAGSGADWCSGGREAQRPRRDGSGTGDIPLRVYFEFGQFMLGMKNLRGIGPGKVIGAGPVLATSVDVMVEGVNIGAGDPITLGTGLGVRITRL